MKTSPRQLSENFDFSVAFHRQRIATQGDLINRDVSLLEFFRRVLDEGLDDKQPLLERLKFIAIFSSNIDEFFMVRVSALKEKIGRGVTSLSDGSATTELLEAIRKAVNEMIARQMDCLRDGILPGLAAHNVAIKAYGELSEDERSFANDYFEANIYPVLTPQAVDPTHPFPYISDGSQNLGFYIEPRVNRRTARVMKSVGTRFFVRLKVPSFVPRFVRVADGTDTFVFVEDLIRANIIRLVPTVEPESCHLFRITRDADMDLHEVEAEDLLETMEENLKLRRFGDVVRLEVSSSMPAEMVEHLSASLEITDEDVYSVDGPLNAADFWDIVSLDRPDLKDRPIRIKRPDIFDSGESIFDIIGRSDHLLHHPYMPYSIVTDLIREAAEDPDVLAIKICLYRIGSESPIAPLLIEASERGKQVTVLIEIKARFDEANNIEWGKKLERAGVHVVYGIVGLKTHAKTTLIVRREDDKLKRYVHLATGNYNPATSAVYTDLGILTADEEIGADVTELFNYLTVYTQPEAHRKLLVAPLNLRERMTEMIDREAENARAGRPARIIAKINRLADAEIVRSLYAASQAGVKIELIVRGVCTLRPGVPGFSENIRVRSVVGRLLEHSRVYYFQNDGDPEIYVGSADWMPRNLDRRVEVIAPVQDRGIKRFLADKYLVSYLKDNVNAREMMPDGTYRMTARTDGEEPFDSQLYFEDQRKPLDFIAGIKK